MKVKINIKWFFFLLVSMGPELLLLQPHYLHMYITNTPTGNPETRSIYQTKRKTCSSLSGNQSLSMIKLVNC